MRWILCVTVCLTLGVVQPSLLPGDPRLAGSGDHQHHQHDEPHADHGHHALHGGHGDHFESDEHANVLSEPRTKQQSFSRPHFAIRPEDLNLNPGVGESGQKDTVREECGAGLVCVPEEQCDRYTGFVVGVLQSRNDPSLPTVAIQRCRLGEGTGFCCQERPRPLKGFENRPQQQQFSNQQQHSQQFNDQQQHQQFNDQQQHQQFNGQQHSQQFPNQQQHSQQLNDQQQHQQFNDQQHSQQFPNQRQHSQQFNDQKQHQQFNDQQHQQLNSQQQHQQFNDQQQQQFNGRKQHQQFNDQQQPQQFNDQQHSQQLPNHQQPQQFSNQEQSPQNARQQHQRSQFGEQDQSQQVFGTLRQKPQQRFETPPGQQIVGRPFISIRPEDLNLNPGVGESGQKDTVREECGAGLVCVPEEQCDRYTGFVVGVLKSRNDPSLPTVAIQRCRLGEGTGFCCQEIPGRPGATHQRPPVQPNRQPVRADQQALRGESRPSVRVPSRRPVLRKPARFANNPFLSGSIPSGLSTPTPSAGSSGDATSPLAPPRPAPSPSRRPPASQNTISQSSAAPTRPHHHTGEEIGCGQGLQCVQVNRCGADGYIVNRAGLGAASAGLHTYCLTSFGRKGICCRVRATASFQSNRSPRPQGASQKPRPLQQSQHPQQSQQSQQQPQQQPQQSQQRPQQPQQRPQQPQQRPQQSPQRPQQSPQRPQQSQQRPQPPDIPLELSLPGLQPPPPSSPPSSPAALREAPTSADADSSDEQLTGSSQEELLDVSECGISTPTTTPGIQTADGDASFGEFPWQAIIFYSNYTFICSGSLISDRHVALAAHCLHYLVPSDILVRVGEFQINSDQESYSHQDIDVAKIQYNPAYRQGPLFNDVAVLTLVTPVRPAPHISPICLPEPQQQFAGQRGYVTGWAKTAFDDGLPENLRKVDVPILESDVCEVHLQRTRLGSFFRLHSSFTCAGGEPGNNACQDGGILSTIVDGRHILAGISSWGVDCDGGAVPAVFANAPAALKFIQVEMGLTVPDTSAGGVRRASDRNVTASYGR